MKRIISAAAQAALLALLLAAPALAEITTTFDSCSDGRGRTVSAAADPQQAVFVRSIDMSGTPAIRYNPAALPRLTPPARLFFFAHECARHVLGTAGQDPLSAAQARQADCVGLNTLLGAGLLKPEDVPALQTQLGFSEEEWSRLPGPPRNFDLAGCQARGNVLKLPAATPPSAQQGGWNSCVRACADRLWGCQKNCRGNDCSDACLGKHRECKAACGGAPAGTP